jgi:hypothetical protein
MAVGCMTPPANEVTVVWWCGGVVALNTAESPTKESHEESHNRQPDAPFSSSTFQFIRTHDCYIHVRLSPDLCTCPASKWRPSAPRMKTQPTVSSGLCCSSPRTKPMRKTPSSTGPPSLSHLPSLLVFSPPYLRYSPFARQFWRRARDVANRAAAQSATSGRP